MLNSIQIIFVYPPILNRITQTAILIGNKKSQLFNNRFALLALIRRTIKISFIYSSIYSSILTPLLFWIRLIKSTHTINLLSNQFYLCAFIKSIANHFITKPFNSTKRISPFTINFKIFFILKFILAFIMLIINFKKDIIVSNLIMKLGYHYNLKSLVKKLNSLIECIATIEKASIIPFQRFKINEKHCHAIII